MENRLLAPFPHRQCLKRPGPGEILLHPSQKAEVSTSLTTKSFAAYAPKASLYDSLEKPTVNGAYDYVLWN